MFQDGLVYVNLESPLAGAVDLILEGRDRSEPVGGTILTS